MTSPRSVCRLIARLTALLCAALVLVTHAHCAQEWGGRMDYAALRRPADPAPAQQPERGCQHIGCLCQGAVTAESVVAPEIELSAEICLLRSVSHTAVFRPGPGSCLAPAFRPLHASSTLALRAWLGAFLA